MGKKFTGEDKLLQELNRLVREINEKGIKTRAAYKSHMRNFLRFYWREYHGQKISNIEGKHIRAYAAYMKEQGLAPTTIKSRLSGIRFYHEKAGGKKKLPDNKELGLEKRKVGTYDRAWTLDEVKGGIKVATSMGRMDACHAIYISFAFALRIEEVCRVRREDIEKAITYDGLTIKGKGGQVRTYPVEFEIQKKVLRYFYDYAKKNNLLPHDCIISPRGKGGVEKQINSLENWMYTNRHKFAVPNREDEIRDGKKPRSKSLTWHGLRYARAQLQYEKYKAEGRENPRKMTSMVLGHNRDTVTPVYLPELPPGRQKKQ